MKVTFDTNALDRASRPERYPKNPLQPDFIKIYDGIKGRNLKGYFSETLVTLEAVQKRTVSASWAVHVSTNTVKRWWIETPVKSGSA